MTVTRTPRWPGRRALLALALAGLLATAAGAPSASPTSGPGDPLPLPSFPPLAYNAGASAVGHPNPPAAPSASATPLLTVGEPPDSLPAACLAGPNAPPAEAAAPLLPPLDLLAHTRWLRLPVLMYHYVEPPARGLSLVERGLTLTPEQFAAQMGYLHDRGYVTVSLYDLAAALRGGRPLPPRAVVLTFDGGHRALLRYAVPVMQGYGFTGTIFAITKGMDENQALYLTWAEARDLHAQGWDIEPHTRTHLQLAGRSPAVQWAELCGSMLDVASHIGVTPRFMAYPSGLYDAQTLSLVKRLGFWGGVTTRINRWHRLADEYTLSRVRVNATESLQQFITSVDGDLK